MKISKSDLIKLIKEEAIKLKEAVDSEPNADWAKYGLKVDKFLNETIEKATELYDEGEVLLFNDDQVNKTVERYDYVSTRLGFFKQLIGKLSQKFESFRKD
jgi:hypothetical protein